MKRLLVLACVLSGLGLPAQALEPIDTDGPDFVESSEVVPRGHFQYEVGSPRSVTALPRRARP